MPDDIVYLVMPTGSARDAVDIYDNATDAGVARAALNGFLLAYTQADLEEFLEGLHPDTAVNDHRGEFQAPPKDYWYVVGGYGDTLHVYHHERQSDAYDAHAVAMIFADPWIRTYTEAEWSKTVRIIREHFRHVDIVYHHEEDDADD